MSWWIKRLYMMKRMLELSHLHLSASSWLFPLCPPDLKPLIYCQTTDVFPAWNESGGNSNPVIFPWSWITATTTPEKQPTGGEKQESSEMLMLLRMCSLSMNKIVQPHKEDQIDLSGFGHWLANQCRTLPDREHQLLTQHSKTLPLVGKPVGCESYIPSWGIQILCLCKYLVLLLVRALNAPWQRGILGGFVTATFRKP